VVGQGARRRPDGFTRDPRQPQEMVEGGEVAAAGERVDRGLGQRGQLLRGGAGEVATC
jgi:hypothetical protein